MSKKNPMATGHHFGHEIYLDRDEFHYGEGGRKIFGDWRYADTNTPITNPSERPCPKCHLLPTEDDHDPCIANLPGVSNACCGHGVGGAYVAFDDGKKTLRDEDALIYFNSVVK